MNRECARIREWIAESLVTHLAPEKESGIDTHLNRCPACRRFREELIEDGRRLAGYAGSFEDSIVRIEKRVGEALAESVSEQPVRIGYDWRYAMKRRVLPLAVAAAIVVAALLVVDNYTGFLTGATPAFADVLTKIGEAQSVVFMEKFEFEGVDPFDVESFVSAEGIVRSNLPNDMYTIVDHQGGTNLQVFPQAKRAMVSHRVGRRKGAGLFNYLTWLQNLHKESGRFIGREEVDGQTANVFLIEVDAYDRRKIWADAKTDLPFKVLVELYPNPQEEIIVPKIFFSTGDFGGDPGYSQQITISGGGGISKRMTWTCTDFKWNADLDQSIFDMKPPEGYDVLESEIDVSDKGEDELARALGIWAEMSGRSFPADINYLGDVEKVRSMLIERFDRDGDPEEEFKQAMAEGHKLLKGLMFAQQRRVDGTWHYAGEGIRLGDAKVPVCWWQSEESDSFRVLYGDLRIESLAPGDLPVYVK
ncbi:MAG: hypothetical protein JSV33_14040 [bacterium]|nr:MAG: hypothetical protein JSV33_14040 [bacterium]